MPIKSIRVNLSFIPKRLDRLRAFGKEHLMRSTRGLQDATICMRIIDFILELRWDPEVQAYLKMNGGTLLDLIRRAVKQYISADD